MPMERLTADDQVMLWPDAIWPQEIGALAVLEGAVLLDSSGGVRIEAIRQAVERRLHLVPRFRQLLYMPRRGLGGPLWVDATTFNLADHVRTAPLPAPGDEATFLSAVQRLLRRRLDRSRPLWEMWFMPGLPDNRIGLFVRMHHAIADGIAGVATVGAFLDPVPDPPRSPARTWTPAPLPTAQELIADNLRRHANQLGHAVATLAHPVTIARQAAGAWPAMRELFTAQPALATSLNRMVGPDRTLALIRSSLDLVKGIAHTHGATVNDVLLAVTAGGLRGLLRSRGELVNNLTVQIDVPVTLRPTEARDNARGNLIGQMLVPLPVGVSDPIRRLVQIAEQTATCKAESHPPVGVMLRSRIARRVLLKLLDRRPVNVTSADLPGPPRPVYLAGARLLEVFPVLPLMANVSLGVGALSYAGQFNITAVADLDAYSDLLIFTTSVQEELAALAASTSVSHGHY
jgi:diacylglycerol O-acyltransferase / wax synthase